MEDDRSLTAFLATVTVGDVLTGTIVEATRSGVTVLLDGFAATPAGFIGGPDFSLHSSARSPGRVGSRVAAEVIAVDLARRQVRLSRSATENPELWAFLRSLQQGQLLSGTVAAVERFGVFVDLDDGPRHPTLPGVGFVTGPELSWLWISDPSEAVSTGQRVTGEFLAVDTTNGEARLSLRATQPDPFLEFARTAEVGQVLQGSVTALLPFGFFVRVHGGIEGLIPLSEPATAPIGTPGPAVQPGDQVLVTITEIDLDRRRLALARHH